MLGALTKDIEFYQPRNPRKTSFFQCINEHNEQLQGVWDDRYENKYGYWRAHITDVIEKYLKCGDPHEGFARIKCEDCKSEKLLAFSCKCRFFCPSCHQRKVIEFGEHLYEEVLEEVPHRQWVFSLPKRLRIYFMFDRKLLAKLSKCAWNILSRYLKQSVSLADSTPGVVIAVQTFGDFLNFNPHLHIIATDGCFYGEDKFMLGTKPNASDLTLAFRDEVFNMLKKEEKINNFIIENMKRWNHSGFNIYCGEPIFSNEQESMERLAQYIIRAPISKERLNYIPNNQTSTGISKIIFRSKNDHSSKTFNALDWLAKLVTHIPNKNEQLCRYYGFYSNKSRGMRKKSESIDETQEIVESDITTKKRRKTWARLIQKVYGVDPLICTNCGGKMKIVSFIEDKTIIKAILKHLKLWLSYNHDPPTQDTKYNCLPKYEEDNLAEGLTENYDYLQSEHIEFSSQDIYEYDFSQITNYEED